MADQSAQHGRRIDDELDHEVEGLVRGTPVATRASEDLEPEPTDLVTTPLGDPEADGQHRELLERSELARFLRPSALPTDAAGLVVVARDEHAPEPVLAELGRLPPRTTFSTMAEIWQALGHPVEHRGDAAPPPRTAPPEPVVADDAEHSAEVRPLRPEPAPAAPPAAPVAPAVEDARLHPVRGLVGLGLELVRAALSTAERVVATVQERIER